MENERAHVVCVEWACFKVSSKWLETSDDKCITHISRWKSVASVVVASRCSTTNYFGEQRERFFGCCCLKGGEREKNWFLAVAVDF